MRELPVIIAIGIGLSLCVGCGGPTKSTGGAMQTVFLPYIESADVPATVTADEDFTITLRLSTALNPDLLRGASADLRVSQAGWAGQLFDSNWLYEQFDMWPVLAEPAYEGSVAAEYILPCRMWSPGTHVLRIRSADLPENGGIEFERQLTSSLYYPDNPHFKWLEFDIEVLPKSS